MADSKNENRTDEQMQGGDYRIRLENYYGPLDLLLYLIKQHEVDIFHIPIAEITQQYIDYIEKIRQFDIDIASEFLVMAATLMRIKSRELTPSETDDLEEEEMDDPREQLVQNLIQYRTFKDRARALRECARKRRAHFSRPDLRDRFQNDDTDVSPDELDMSLWPLVRCFARIQEETLLDAPSTLVYDDIPQQLVMDRILKQIEEGTSTTFEELVGPHPSRYQAVSYFLGVLELAHRKELHIVQDQADEEISIAPGPHFS